MDWMKLFFLFLILEKYIHPVHPEKSCHPVEYHVHPIRQDAQDIGQDFRMGRDERDEDFYTKEKRREEKRR
jgi:hypothetical protein